MSLRRLLGVVLALGALAAFVHFFVFRPRPARMHAVGRGPVAVEVFGTGSVESRRTVELGFEVTGRVARLEADQGDLVKDGEELAAVDATTFRAAVAFAAESARLAGAGIERLASDVTRAAAVLEAAEANVRRVRELAARNSAALSLHDLDEAEERLKVALASLAGARAARTEGERRLDAARTALEQARAELARTVVRSPFDGVVLRREREVGDVVVPGSPVLRLAATDVVWASAWVDETFLDPLRAGQPARIHLRSAPDRALPGRVARIGREVDRETRELLVDVSLEPLPDRLAFGQRADLWIEVERRPDAVRIPPGFVAWAEGRPGAFVADGGRARFRPLRLGARGREWVEVEDGLRPGEVVARAAGGGAAPLADGVRVAPVAEAAAPERP